MVKKTPLYECHLEGGGKMVEFAGYQLPVQYSSIIAEHNAVRNACGLFDVSHMGEFLLSGEDSLKNLNEILTNDFTSLQPGRIRYSPMCYADGGTVDDLLVYCIDSTEYFIVVNASNREKDFAHMEAQIKGSATLRDVSDDYAQLALQGPDAEKILSSFCPLPVPYYSFIRTDLLNTSALVSRTGYTGEDGFEIYCPCEAAPAIFNALHKAGATLCGLGARDTLRLEAGMPLYGHELLQNITPLEAGLGRFVKVEKPSFTGRQALQNAPARRLIGIELTEKGIARHGDLLLNDGGMIGTVTSGTFSPTFNKPIAMALIDIHAESENLQAEIRGRRLPVKELPLPFYKRNK